MHPSAGSHEIKEPCRSPSGARYAAVRVGSILRQDAEGGPWHWSVDPYQGCEFACSFCQARLDRRDYRAWRSFETQVGVKSNAVEVLMRELRSEQLEGRPIVLGAATDPWQPAEEHTRLTRAILEALTQLDDLDLRVHTRSSLIARDTDVLRRLAAKGRVTAVISIASLDERINRLLEPKAPSALRRLAALEALALAGVPVGLMVSPVMPGLDEEELRLEALLTRAANAGARFAGMSLMTFGPGQRENFLAHVTTAYPEFASRFRRVIGRRAPSDEERQALFQEFERLCARLGLLPLAHAELPRPPRRSAPSQLALFEDSPAPL